MTWRIETASGAEARSSSGLTISADTGPPATNAELLILLAGYGVAEQMTPPLLTRIDHLARRHERIIGADAAGWFLAELGLLDGHEAVVHWQDLHRFAEAYPNVSVATRPRVASGRVMTCGGASSALDLMLEWLGTRFGRTVSTEVSKLFLYDVERDHAVAALPERAPVKLQRAMDAMHANIEEPLTLDAVAKRAGTSARTLDRLFQGHVQLSPARYYTLHRLKRAQDLLTATRLTQAEIAARCGYASAAALARAYRSAFGEAPGATRRSAQP
ncbi:GlxA family transcriptional regulator [Pontivivens insulae]|uniref:GlxA family transcriptional regulator n=1 Tax=Pontivivens insulae TaxID=1639689 RepID=UPI0013C33440|nr:helix-turn-helix domain-containing protein [Pontivivens insulae]